MNQIKTDFLCASSTFLTGMGSVLNLRGNLYDYNSCDNPDETAIAQDWGMVGRDFELAMAKADENIDALAG
jgi:hypothetical protein